MPPTPPNLCGCFVSPEETDKACNALAAAGCDPIAANRVSIRGEWERQGRKPVFLSDADPDPSWHQDHGTCCGQGVGHAIQTSIRWAIANGSRLGKPDLCSVAWEPLYVLSRTVIGKNQLGTGDGSYVPWLFVVGYKMGLLRRDTYGQYNLSKPQEDWAVTMSQPRQYQFPQVMLDAMAGWQLEGAMKITDLDTAADCLASGYCLVRGASRATGSQRDADGISRTVECGGHCEHLNGLFVDNKGRRVWLERNSWANTPGQPHGGGDFKLADGSTHPVPDGVGGLLDDDVQFYITNGDLWSFEPPEVLWGTNEQKPSDYVEN